MLITCSGAKMAEQNFQASAKSDSVIAKNHQIATTHGKIEFVAQQKILHHKALTHQYGVDQQNARGCVVHKNNYPYCG